MGKDRGGDVMEQPRRCLGGAFGKVPHDEPYAHAVVEAEIGRQLSEPGEVRVFAAAVHAHVSQPPHFRRFGQLPQKGRNVGMVDRPQGLHGARPVFHHSTAFFFRLHSPAPMAVAKVAFSGTM